MNILNFKSLPLFHRATYEWWVFSTAIAEGWLMLQCERTGRTASVRDPSAKEWRAAFSAPSQPYRWMDDARVVMDPLPASKWNLYRRLVPGHEKTRGQLETEISKLQCSLLVARMALSKREEQLKEARSTEDEDDDDRKPVRVADDRQSIEYLEHYEIELARITSPMELIQWIYHLSRKTWVTRDMLRALIEYACGERGWPMFFGQEAPSPVAPGRSIEGDATNSNPA